MRKERLELSRVAPLEPKSSASTNSAIQQPFQHNNRPWTTGPWLKCWTLSKRMTEETIETIEEVIEEASDTVEEIMEEMSEDAEEDLSNSVKEMMDK